MYAIKNIETLMDAGDLEAAAVNYIRETDHVSIAEPIRLVEGRMEVKGG